MLHLANIVDRILQFSMRIIFISSHRNLDNFDNREFGYVRIK